MSSVKRNMNEAINFIDTGYKTNETMVKYSNKENYLAVSLNSLNMTSL